MSAISKLFRFGREVRAEAGRISWPSWPQTRQMALMVFILVSIIAVFLVIVDVLIGSGINALLT